MSNSIATVRRRLPSAPPSPVPSDPVSALPMWMQMLIGNYPSAKASDRTLEIFLLAFRSYDKDVMERAVVSCVMHEKWLPTTAVINGYVQAEKLKEDSKNNPNFWKICPNCEERVPDINNCLACTDLAQEWLMQKAEFEGMANHG